MTEEVVLKILKQVNPIITKSTDLVNSGDFNSIEIVTMVALLEEELNVEIDLDMIDAQHFNNVKNITKTINYCAQKQAKKAVKKSIVSKKTVEKEDTYTYPGETHTVLEWVEHAAKHSGNKMAMCDPYGNKMTFKQVLQASKAIGTYIHQKYGCTRRPFIVCERRNIKSLVMFLGVVWSGNYYVALDESFNLERLNLMIDIVKPEGILWHYNQKNETMKSLDSNLYSDMEKTVPDEDFLQSVKNGYKYNDPLYGVYTSGTTGVPKCIIKSHGAMVDFITAYVKLFKFNHNDVLGSKLSLMFDAITKDMYTSMFCGCSLHIMARGAVLPTDDAAYINKHHITSSVWSPSLLINFAKMHVLDSIEMPSLRRLLFVGEALPAKYMNYWYGHMPNVMYVNLYGTSEMTGNCLYKIVDGETTLDVVPLDAIFPGYDVFLLDEDNNEVKGVGAAGEICAGGDLICIDQLGKPMDPEKFTPNPLPNPKSSRIYRSGDIVRIDENGSYIFLGRSDYRFKHAGYRIEPGEIEEIINRHQVVEQCVVLYDHIGMKIVLFWMGDENREEELYSFIMENLPPHMLPGKYMHMDAFPLNNSGKIHRARLNQWLEETKGELNTELEI